MKKFPLVLIVIFLLGLVSVIADGSAECNSRYGRAYLLAFKDLSEEITGNSCTITKSVPFSSCSGPLPTIPSTPYGEDLSVLVANLVAWHGSNSFVYYPQPDSIPSATTLLKSLGASSVSTIGYGGGTCDGSETVILQNHNADKFITLLNSDKTHYRLANTGIIPYNIAEIDDLDLSGWQSRHPGVAISGTYTFVRYSHANDDTLDRINLQCEVQCPGASYAAVRNYTQDQLKKMLLKSLFKYINFKDIPSHLRDEV